MNKIKFFALALSISFVCIFALAKDVVPDPNQVPEATTYQIRNVKFQELLRPENANGATGTPIVLYPAQPWKCMTWRLQPAGDTAFHLKNLFTSKTISAVATTNTSPCVTQVPLAKTDDQSPAWQFTKLQDDSYQITDGKSGHALTAVKELNGSQIKIVVEPWKNLEEQKWRLEKIDPKELTM